MTKKWTPEHLRLAKGVLYVRSKLRELLPRLAESDRRVVAEACSVLTAGLKARPAQRKEPA